MGIQYVAVQALATRDEALATLNSRLETSERDKRTLQLAVDEVWRVVHQPPATWAEVVRMVEDALYVVMH